MSTSIHYSSPVRYADLFKCPTADVPPQSPLHACSIRSFMRNNIDVPPQSFNYHSRPKLMVCHDMKGNYLNDRWENGSNFENAFQLLHWSYIDIFCYFSHEFITIPPRTWIEVCHRNHTPILGTIITEWESGYKICSEIFCSSTSTLLFVDKIVALTQRHNLDGWLINIENCLSIPDGHVENMLLFLKSLTAALNLLHSSAQNHNHDSWRSRRSWSRPKVIWYDAVTVEGELQWQDTLNELNKPFYDACDGIFVNYTWKDSSTQISDNMVRTYATKCSGSTTTATTTGTTCFTRNGGEHKCADLRPQQVAKSRADIFFGCDVFGRNTFGGGRWNCSAAYRHLWNAAGSEANSHCNSNSNSNSNNDNSSNSNSSCTSTNNSSSTSSRLELETETYDNEVPISLQQLVHPYKGAYSMALFAPGWIMEEFDLCGDLLLGGQELSLLEKEPSEQSQEQGGIDWIAMAGRFLDIQNRVLQLTVQFWQQLLLLEEEEGGNEMPPVVNARAASGSIDESALGSESNSKRPNMLLSKTAATAGGHGKVKNRLVRGPLRLSFDLAAGLYVFVEGRPFLHWNAWMLMLMRRHGGRWSQDQDQDQRNHSGTETGTGTEPEPAECQPEQLDQSRVRAAWGGANICRIGHGDGSKGRVKQGHGLFDVHMRRSRSATGFCQTSCPRREQRKEERLSPQLQLPPLQHPVPYYDLNMQSEVHWNPSVVLPQPTAAGSSGRMYLHTDREASTESMDAAADCCSNCMNNASEEVLLVAQPQPQPQPQPQLSWYPLAAYTGNASLLIECNPTERGSDSSDSSDSSDGICQLWRTKDLLSANELFVLSSASTGSSAEPPELCHCSDSASSSNTTPDAPVATATAGATAGAACVAEITLAVLSGREICTELGLELELRYMCGCECGSCCCCGYGCSESEGASLSESEKANRCVTLQLQLYRPHRGAEKLDNPAVVGDSKNHTIADAGSKSVQLRQGVMVAWTATPEEREDSKEPVAEETQTETEPCAQYVVWETHRIPFHMPLALTPRPCWRARPLSSSAVDTTVATATNTIPVIASAKIVVTTTNSLSFAAGAEATTKTATGEVEKVFRCALDSIIIKEVAAAVEVVEAAATAAIVNPVDNLTAAVATSTDTVNVPRSAPPLPRLLDISGAVLTAPLHMLCGSESSSPESVSNIPLPFMLLHFNLQQYHAVALNSADPEEEVMHCVFLCVPAEKETKAIADSLAPRESSSVGPPPPPPEHAYHLFLRGSNVLESGSFIAIDEMTNRRANDMQVHWELLELPLAVSPGDDINMILEGEDQQYPVDSLILLHCTNSSVGISATASPLMSSVTASSEALRDPPPFPSPPLSSPLLSLLSVNIPLSPKDDSNPKDTAVVYLLLRSVYKSIPPLQEMPLTGSSNIDCYSSNNSSISSSSSTSNLSCRQTTRVLKLTLCSKE